LQQRYLKPFNEPRLQQQLHKAAWPRSPAVTDLPLAHQRFQHGGRHMKVLAAMSGGVDSAVAAARAVDAGHEVTGVHLALSKNPQTYRSGARGCCSKEDAHDARRAADVLGIPFYVWDLSDRFAADVVSDFVAEYAAGRTPNPCLRCNEKIKFSAVLDRGIALGFDAVCTGHYARLIRTGNEVKLHRAVDAAKDQSYVLGVLNVEQLRRSYFPLGCSLKAEVRTEARDRGLAVADKPDSHDICFVANSDTAGFLEKQLGRRPGDIVDLEGRKVGEHAGSHQFTIGQRRGLRLGTPAPDGQPRFVLSITPTTNTITVGPREALAIKIISAIRPTWMGERPHGEWSGRVQVRAHGQPMTATVWVHDHDLEVVLDSTTTGVAPGQAVVLYAGSRVIGSATISATQA
jgi:tRNA-uridine 2-sulfurtransferase